MARRRRDRLARGRHVHHVLGHRRLDHRPPRPQRAGPPSGGQPRRERDRGRRAVELDPVRARAHRDAVCGQRARGSAAAEYMQVPLGQATATQPGGGQPGATAAFDVAFDPTRSGRAPSAPTGARSASRACSPTDDVSASASDVRTWHSSRRAITEPTRRRPGRFYNRIFRSASGLRRGHRPEEAERHRTSGAAPTRSSCRRTSPTASTSPTTITPGTPTPLLLNGHSLDVNHNEYIAVSPNLYNQLGDQRSSIVITPLARGMDTWYIDAGFKDVMEAWEDLRDHYSVDDDRTSIGGYSMGGYMTYRMGLLMPDRFAAANAVCRAAGLPALGAAVAPRAGRDYHVAGFTNNIVVERPRPAVRDQQRRRRRAGARGRRAAAGAVVPRRSGNPHLFYFYPDARPLRPDPRGRVGPHARLPRPASRRATCRPTRCATSATRRWTCPSTGCGSTAPTGSTAWRAHARRLVLTGRVGVRVRVGPGGGVHARPRPRAQHDAVGHDRVSGPAVPRHAAGHHARPGRADPRAEPVRGRVPSARRAAGTAGSLSGSGPSSSPGSSPSTAASATT